MMVYKKISVLEGTNIIRRLRDEKDWITLANRYSEIFALRFTREVCMLKIQYIEFTSDHFLKRLALQFLKTLALVAPDSYRPGVTVNNDSPK